jgi:DNA-binding response OmpR family regulator
MMGPDGARRKTPRAVLGGAALTARIAEQLRRFGWDVQTATTTDEAVTLALEANPTAVVLPVEAEDGESGYLTCAKLRRVRPRVKLVLVGDGPTAKDQRLAGFVGATLVGEAVAADEVAKLA